MKVDDHMLNDFLCTLCCPYVSICQMGTAVDHAMGYEMTGCCHVSFDHDHQNHNDGMEHLAGPSEHKDDHKDQHTSPHHG